MEPTSISVPTNTATFVLHTPTFVGYWQLGGPNGIQLAQEKKPNGVVRFFCKQLLGLQWKDCWPPKP